MSDIFVGPWPAKDAALPSPQSWVYLCRASRIPRKTTKTLGKLNILCLGLHERPNMAQDDGSIWPEHGLKGPQDGILASRWLNIALRWSEYGPKKAQESPRWPQDGPPKAESIGVGSPGYHPKPPKAPRKINILSLGLHERPNMAQDDGSRWHQHGLKRPQDGILA